MPAVDDYLDGPASEHIQNLLMDTVPQAGHGTSYRMAALSPRVIDTVRDGSQRSSRPRGTIRLTAATPLPDEVVPDIVRYQIEQIAGPTRQMPPRTAAHAGRRKSIHIGICGSPAYPG